MKHLRKFFESNEDIKEDILENFLSISDLLGNPIISSSVFGKLEKWILRWDLKLDVTHLQEAEGLIKKLKLIVEEIDSVMSASERLDNFDFTMSLSTELRIELTPKETGDDEYEFISGYNYRVLSIRKREIERFFRSRGCIVARWDIDSSLDEGSQRNDLEIYLSKSDIGATSEFQTLFNRELEQKRDDIDRDYECSINTNYVGILSLEEKSYIDLV